MATATAILLSVSVWAVSSYVVNIRQARDKADAAATQEKLAHAESRRLYAESLAQNAELAIQRGDWKLALDQLNAAIQEKHPAVTDLRVRRLDVYDSLNQPGIRNQEIQALDTLELSPVNRARLHLRQGESLCYDGHAEEGGKRIQAAIQTGHLPDHEDAYGRGLTAETSTDALTCFRKALQLSPYTYRYHQMMWLMLATSGYLDEEDRQLNASAVLFPHDGNLVKMRALLEAHRGHDETAKQLLDSLGPALSAKDREQVQTWCEIEWSFRYYLVDRWDGMEPDLPAQKYPMVQLKLMFLSQSPFAMAATNLGTQMPSYLERSLGNFSKALLKWKVGDFHGALRLLEENEASHREATGCFIKGLILSTGRPAGMPGDPESDADYRQRMMQSVEAFTEASRLPSIYAGIPEQALVGAVFPELHLWNRTGIPPAEKHEILQRIVSRYKQAAQATRLRPFHASLAAQLALKLDDYDFARQAAALLPEDQPKRYETFIAIEKQAGNVKEALRMGDEALRRFPGNEAFNTLRQEFTENLPKLIDDLQKSLERRPSK